MEHSFSSTCSSSTVAAAAAASSSTDKRDMSQVRAAYRSGDIQTARALHTKPLAHKEAQSSGSSGLVKSVVFGGLDGILTVFAVVTAGAGASGVVASSVILILGFANLLADGFAMGMGEFTSSKAEKDHILEERNREEWEFTSYPEGERQEMIDLYIHKGMTSKDAARFIDLLMKYPKVFVDRMMVDELGLLVADGDLDLSPWQSGLVMFGSFVLFGVVPLLAYLPRWWSPAASFLGSCILTAICLAVLGGLKGHLCHTPVLWSSVRMVLSGALAAATSFYVSKSISHLVATTNPAAAAQGNVLRWAVG